MAAGFLESRVARTALRELPTECASVALHVQILSDLTLQHGVASTFEAARAAEMIRREIGNMFRDGTLAMTIAKYSYYGLDDTWASYDLMEAAEHARWIAWGIGTVVMGVTLALWRILSLRQRKRAEVTLRESEERFRATFFQAAVGIAQTTPDAKWLLLNDRFCEMVGYTQAELHGKTFLDVTYPDDREASLTAVRRLLAGDISSWLTEKRYIRKDGTIIWARLCLSLVRDQANRPQYFISVVEDVTDKVKAEGALRDSEQRLTLAQSAAHLGVWHRNLGTHVITIGGEYARLYGLGLDRTTLTHEEWLNVIHPDDRARVQALIREALERTHVFDTEYRIVWPDGSEHWLLAKGTVFVDDSGRPIRTTGVTMDITERKQAEAALRESEERFRSMADTAPVMIWVSGPDKLCTFFNKVWLEFTGRTMEQELGSGWTAGVHPDDVNRCVGTYSASFDARRSFQMEYRVRRADGEYRWVLDTGVPRIASGGVFAGYIGSCIDITEVKYTLEAALASQKLETVGQLASGIAHDFNNLLGGILVSAELALAEHAEGSSTEEGLQRIRTAAIRGGEIVSQLMTYTGQESPAFQMVDVSCLVEEMLHLLKVSISKHATLETDLGEDLPAVHGSPTQVRQVVMNLITNASEAIGERDGVIRVSTARVSVGPDPRIMGAANLPAGDYLKLEVSDTGSGMTADVQRSIFDPFFTTKFTGRGLGLAVVNGIVRGLRGTIHLVSTPGKGTTFQILLPCDETTAQATHRMIPERKRETSTSAATILVVEDEATIRRPISMMLRQEGFSVIEANDGSTALDLLRKNNIDVLLLDICLPGATSREVLDAARFVRPDVAVIVTSAQSEQTAAAAVGDCMHRFLQKPFSIDDLNQAIRESLSSQGIQINPQFPSASHAPA